jgi:hypothetical protein
MGYTFRFCSAGGVDAVESEFGDGRTPALCGPLAGWGGDDGSLPGFRHFPQNRLQDFDRYRAHGLEALSDRSRRPVRYANQLPPQVETLIVQLIIDRVPAATTAEGAAAALDHVLNDDSLWHGSAYAGEVFLRQLIEAARDYINRMPRDDRSSRGEGRGLRSAPASPARSCRRV